MGFQDILAKARQEAEIKERQYQEFRERRHKEMVETIEAFEKSPRNRRSKAIQRSFKENCHRNVKVNGQLIADNLLRAQKESGLSPTRYAESIKMQLEIFRYLTEQKPNLISASELRILKSNGLLEKPKQPKAKRDQQVKHVPKPKKDAEWETVTVHEALELIDFAMSRPQVHRHLKSGLFESYMDRNVYMVRKDQMLFLKSYLQKTKCKRMDLNHFKKAWQAHIGLIDDSQPIKPPQEFKRDKYLSQNQIKKITGLSSQTIIKLKNSGHIPTVWVDGVRRVPADWNPGLDFGTPPWEYVTIKQAETLLDIPGKKISHYCATGMIQAEMWRGVWHINKEQVLFFKSYIKNINKASRKNVIQTYFKAAWQAYCANR